MDERIITTNKVNFPNILGLGKWLFDQLQKAASKNKIAQILAETGETDSYASLLERCIRTAITLKKKGIEQGDIICSCTNNHLNSCVPLIATQFIGGVYASLDPSLSEFDMRLLLTQVRPKIIFSNLESAPILEEILRSDGTDCEIVVFGESDEYTEFAQFLGQQPEESDFNPVEIDITTTAFMFFSSGTTGYPKAICSKHSNFMTLLDLNSILKQTLDYERVAFEAKLRGNMPEVNMWYTTYYWLSAVSVLFHAILFEGISIICDKFNTTQLWTFIDKYNVHTLMLSSTKAIQMCKSEKPQNVDVSRLMRLVIGGNKTHEEFVLGLRNMLPNTTVFQMYGLTEAGVCTIFLPPIKSHMISIRNKPNSVGYPVNGFTFKIVDIETEEILGANEVGEIRIKSDTVMNGYYKLDSSFCFDKDGFLKTGDSGYYDEERCFYIEDRLKEVLKYRDWHVQPLIIEQEILTNPDVREAIVIGVPHPEDGEHPLAIVVIDENSSLTPEELINYVDQKVDDRKRLRGGVKFVNELPKTPSDKIKRMEVKKWVNEGKI